MEIKEIRVLNDKELAKRLEDSYRELFDLNFQMATKKLVNHREIPKVRRNIARLKTLMRERELGIR